MLRIASVKDKRHAFCERFRDMVHACRAHIAELVGARCGDGFFERPDKFERYRVRRHPDPYGRQSGCDYVGNDRSFS